MRACIATSTCVLAEDYWHLGLPAQVVTDGDGRAAFEYTTGRALGMAILTGSAGVFGGAVGIVQAPEGVTAISLPIAGALSVRAMDTYWDTQK